MNHRDHAALLRKGVPKQGGIWADLGCGSGAFTLALADLLGQRATIYAVDLDPRALAQLQQQSKARFPDYDIRTLAGDFTRPLKLPSLDGIVMANSLHFHKDKESIVRDVRRILGPTGRLILVEYNVDKGNPWVPFPISYSRWQKLALMCGFSAVEKIGVKPSSFLREVYSALNY
ncbi:MAG: methyltransferase type 12 [Chloroflexi bacterium RBG_19FT_COMBO_62_14]|nr:MAG: methyltransferase type 12 [Chloroflexi bacterium RBG_19FT_COMBO_62_14]